MPPPGSAPSRAWTSPRPLQLLAVLGPFSRGSGDPTFASAPDGTVIRTAQTPEGPMAIRIACLPRHSEVTATAWGAGADWALEHVPDLVGEGDDDTGFVAHHRVVAEAARRFTGWRVPRSNLVMDALVPAIIEQKVTGQESRYGYARLVRRFGEPAPGPAGERGMLVPPTAAGWRGIPSWEFLRSGVDPARADTIQRVCRVAGRLEEATRLAGAPARARLRTVPGVGQWTAAEVAQRALGDADAVSLGDYHVAKNIGWALTGAQVDDDGLTELLEPYAGHRFRVQRLLELAGVARPRHGARMAPRTHLPH
jgi:3-methyladenine DNA glycosylase/8-oxoguanine DNA glycosylase